MLIEINISVQFFLLALLCPIAPVDTAFDALATILVMVPVDAGFSGGYKSFSPI